MQMGGLRPPFLHLDGGIYYGGPQARCRDVLEAGLGVSWVFGGTGLVMEVDGL